jgi:hypothetical protein
MFFLGYSRFCGNIIVFLAIVEIIPVFLFPGAVSGSDDDTVPVRQSQVFFYEWRKAEEKIAR